MNNRKNNKCFTDIFRIILILSLLGYAVLMIRLPVISSDIDPNELALILISFNITLFMFMWFFLRLLDSTETSQVKSEIDKPNITLINGNIITLDSLGEKSE